MMHSSVQCSLWYTLLEKKKSIWASWQHKNATKNFDYTTISDRRWTVSWSKDSYQTCVVKPVYGIPTFPLAAKMFSQKDTYFKNCK